MKHCIKLLKEARKLISNKKNFTTRCLARDSLGNPVPCASPEADKWCALGCMDKVRLEGHYTFKTYLEARNLLPDNLVYQNDYLGHKAILNLFDEAIKKVDKK